MLDSWMGKMIRYYLQMYRENPAHIIKGRSNYYLSLLLATSDSIIKGHIVNPQQHFIGESVVIVNNVKLLCNKYTSFGFYLNLKIFEPKTWEYISKIKGNIFIDIGANAGGYVIPFASNFTKVIAVEPNPSLVEIIRRNAEINNLNNIEIVEAAVSNYSGVADFYVPTYSLQVASLDRNWPLIRGESISILKVKVMTMDELISNMNVNFIDLILIDAEGQEIKILEKSKTAISKARRIIVETEPSNVSKLSDILTNNGYIIRFLDGDAEHGGNLLAEKSI